MTGVSGVSFEGALHAEPPRRNRHPVLLKWLLIALLVVFFGVGGFGMLQLIGAEAGVKATLVGVVLSLVVVGIVVPVFLWLDRFEHEPPGTLIFAFAWGACIATIVATNLNNHAKYLLATEANAHQWVSVSIAPVVEETIKGLGVLILVLYRRKKLDGIVPAMVYAGITAAGFAAVEDVVYLASGYDTAGDGGLFNTFVVRVVMSPFAHPMFTICTGIGLGIGLTTSRKLLRYLAPIAGWSCAVALHVLWNLGAVLSQDGWLVFYIFLQLPLFAGFAMLIVGARRREAAQIGERLSGYVDRGLLTRPEVQMLASMPDRRYAKAWATSHGGKPLQRQMTHFQDAASELAIVRYRLDHRETDARAVSTEQELVALIGTLRQPFLDTALYRHYQHRAVLS